MGILDSRLMVAIQFHKTLHGLCSGRETRTTSLESKLLQQMMDMGEEVLYNIFLYLHKSYDIPECGLCLDIIAA